MSVDLTSKRDERGAVAIIVAVSLTMLLIVTAMVLDFGLVRLDRQRVKLIADTAVMSGLRAAADNADDTYTYRGVCSALEFLQANEPSLNDLPAGICDGSQDNNAVCDPANAANAAFPGNAVYTGTTSSGGVTTEVTIKMPYLVSDGGFPEETYASLSGDTTANNGCDQLGIIVRQSRRPGLGSLATTSDLVLRQRSVGRVQPDDGDLPPALLLLERTQCDVLTLGSSGSPSRIQVFGSLPPTDVPATIHSDSDASASDCGSGPNEQVFQGKQADGVVAFGSGLGTSGIITSVATFNGADGDIVSDAPTNVYGTTAQSASSPGTSSPVTGRSRVGRDPVDDRYLSSVTQRVIDAFTQWTLDDDTPVGYTDRVGCAPDMAALAALTADDAVYIDCPVSSGITLTGEIGAGTIYFHGFIKGGKLTMPDAQQIYIDNTNNSGSRISSDALTLNTGNGFCVRSTLCDDMLPANQCNAAPTGSPDHAQLMIRAGAISNNNDGLLRLCNTSVTLQGGDLGAESGLDPGACLPTSIGTYLEDPDDTTPPCPNGAEPKGDAFIRLSGWTDWTAPNQYGDMTGLSGLQKQSAWNAGEDLALWVETYGDGSDFKMAGGADLNVAGVFMAPNAKPFTFSGNADFDLRDAQFVTRKFAADGGARLLMKVDPYNAITLTEPSFVLVR